MLLITIIMSICSLPALLGSITIDHNPPGTKNYISIFNNFQKICFKERNGEQRYCEYNKILDKYRQARPTKTTEDALAAQKIFLQFDYEIINRKTFSIPLSCYHAFSTVVMYTV